MHKFFNLWSRNQSTLFKPSVNSRLRDSESFIVSNIQAHLSAGILGIKCCILKYLVNLPRQQLIPGYRSVRLVIDHILYTMITNLSLPAVISTSLHVILNQSISNVQIRTFDKAYRFHLVVSAHSLIHPPFT
jgi:hypothetical protein